MASLTGNAGVIKIAGETVAEVRSYSIDMTADTIETSAMGDGSRTYVKGLSTFSGTADVYWMKEHFDDEAAGAGGPDILDKIQAAVGSASVEMIVYPEGVSDGSNWTGNIILTGYSVTASFDSMIEASVSFQGDGAMTYTD